VDELFNRLWDNSDDSDRALARQVLADRYTWMEDGVLDPSIEGSWIAQHGNTDGERKTVHRPIR
jgi:hypothetical protein